MQEAIIAHLENVDGVRLDLKTKIISLHELASVTCVDSLPIVERKISYLEDMAERSHEALSKTYGQLRAELIPEWIDSIVIIYKEKPDSVLLKKYAVEVRQEAGTVKREFSDTIYFRGDQVWILPN